MNIVIFGCGAMASLFAAMLNRHNNRGPALYRIKMFGHWQEHIKVVRSKGLYLQQMGGREFCVPVAVTSSARELTGCDLAIVLVKSWQTQAAAAIIAEVLAPTGHCLTLQNGLGNVEILADLLAGGQVWSGVTALGAHITAPGHVRHAGNGCTYLAKRNDQVDHQQQLVDIFNRSGVETGLSEAAEGLIWAKLAANAAINPLTALLEVRNGDLLTNPTWYGTMISAALEVAEVARSAGITLPTSDPADFVGDVCRRTRRNISSMLQDIRRGAPTEIAAISGAVVKIAKSRRVPVPVNEFLYNAVIRKLDGQAFDIAELHAVSGSYN